MTQWLGPVGSWQPLTLLALGLAQNSSGAEPGLGEICVFVSIYLCPGALKYDLHSYIYGRVWGWEEQ